MKRKDAMLLPESADPIIFGPALNWWRDAFVKRGGVPWRSDLTPDQLTPVALPYVMLIDIDQGGEKLYWRLVGTAHVARNKKDFTGADFDDAYATSPHILAYIKELYKDLVARRNPIWVVNDIVHRQSNLDEGFPLKIRRLMLPLTKNGGEVDICLTILTTEYNAEIGVTCGDQWRSSDYVGEVERTLLVDPVAERLSQRPRSGAAA